MDSINLMIKIRIMLIAFDLFFGLLGMVKLYLYDTFLFSKKKDWGLDSKILSLLMNAKSIE